LVVGSIPTRPTNRFKHLASPSGGAFCFPGSPSDFGIASGGAPTVGPAGVAKAGVFLLSHQSRPKIVVSAGPFGQGRGPLLRRPKCRSTNGQKRRANPRPGLLPRRPTKVGDPRLKKERSHEIRAGRPRGPKRTPAYPSATKCRTHRSGDAVEAGPTPPPSASPYYCFRPTNTNPVVNEALTPVA
jgi:hypothetical protein